MQKKLTVIVPADLHMRVATRAKERGVRMDRVVEESLLLYFRTPAVDLSRIAGPMAGLPSADRKRVEAYIELIRSAPVDLKSAAARRVSQFLAISRAER
jgi:hypothetical protein